MGTDLYVMPLWRYKTRDFTTPMEVLTGFRSRIITPDGEYVRPTRITWLSKLRARWKVRSIRRAVECVNGVRVRWLDEGERVYCEQARGMEALQAYARWLDLRVRMPRFVDPPEGDYYKHPAMNAEERVPWSSPHLVRHDCYNGYFLPCDFARLVHVEPYLNWSVPATRPVGSSVRLKAELDRIGEELEVPDPYTYPEDDPLLAVRGCYIKLRSAAELSCQHGLPMIFDS